MTKIVQWPCSLLRPLNVTYFIRPLNRSAGASILGREQVVSPGVAEWSVTLEIPRETDGQRMRAFEVAVAQMEGRRNIAALCVCDPYRYGAARSPAQEPFSDGTFFSDDTGWVNGDQVAPMVLTGTVQAGATSLSAKLTAPTIAKFSPGDMFSVNGFLYRVLTAKNSGAVTFAPPAREAIPAGTVLKTDPPQFYGRFVDDGQGERMREMIRWGAPITLSFVEAFDR